VAGPSVVRERMPEIERGMVLAGRYQIEEVLGKGGSGLVLRAFDRTAQMVVAVKVLKQELVHDPRWSKRFARELRLGRPIRHPNVGRIFDIGEGDGYRFLTMELATGGTLRDLVKKGGPLRPLPERLADASAAISGLAAIHEAGIVHRDVKPDNMLRMEDGRLVLSDFGLATDLPTAAAVTIMVGTPHYMAPEIRAGEPATARSDVWALGVALYEIFFGKRPERRSSNSLEGYSKPPAPLTSTPVERAMLALCERCLAENPVERPPDAAAVTQLFNAALSSPRRFVNGKRSLAGALALVGVAAVTVLSVHTFRASRDARSGRSAQLTPTGEAKDWTKTASVISTISGHLHCFAISDPNTARVIWGSPRRAEDIEIATGTRRPSALLPETYAMGCPDVSPSGSGVVYGATSVRGTAEVRYSKFLDGRDASIMTVGSDPLWLRSGEEFIYNVDSAHAAVFSLSTMAFTLLKDPQLTGHQLISEKAVSSRRDVVGLLFFEDRGGWTVVVYDGERFNRSTAFGMSAARRIRFDSETDRLFVSYYLANTVSTLASLDWQVGGIRNEGRIEGFDLTDLVRAGADRIVVGRQESHDAWLHEGGKARQLTTDGETFSASMSSGGDLLLGRRTPTGAYSIWFKPQSAVEARELTPGPLDVEPNFGADGDAWTYVDYSQKAIMLCSIKRGSCAQVARSEFLPGVPRLSPDGQRIAFVTQLGTPRLNIVRLEDKRVVDLGAVRHGCPPVWSSPIRVWAFDGTARSASWAERDVVSNEKTGARIDVLNPMDEAGEGQCYPRNLPPDSLLYKRLRVERREFFRLFRLPNAMVL
jgi:serine/threonine protein kinase